jgi:hypothetical protein
MANKSDLKFYLTSAEPQLLNVQPSMSIGGYPSATEYTINALLSNPIDTSDTLLNVDGALGNPYSVVIDEEVMKVNETVDLDGEYGNLESLSVDRGSFNTNKRFHAEGDSVAVAEKNVFFNGSLNSQGKQYRCIAVQNTSSTDTFYDLSFYIKNGSRNSKSKVKVAIEIPTDEIVYGISTGGTSISINDSSLINLYDDNFFNGRLLVVDEISSLNYGQARVIASFDKRTGIITFKNSMPYSIAANTMFRIEQSPSQILSSGRVAPNLTFSTALEIQNAIGGVDLAPFETIYLWFERDISLNTDKYEDNRVIFTTFYRNS